jgi:anti-sigma-K factor RskA
MNEESYIASGILEQYVAGTLSPEEMKEVAEAAATHPKIAAELHAIEEAFLQYAEVHAPHPAPGLLKNILEKIKSETPVEVPPAANVPAAATSRSEAKSIPLRNVERKPKRNSGGLITLLAASFILFVLSALANLYLYREMDQMKNQVAELESEKSAVANNFSAEQARYQEALSQLQIYNDPHNKMLMLKGMPAAPDSKAEVFWEPQTKAVYLKVDHLPAPPSGMAYQLWAIDPDGNPVDAGMINTPSDDQIALHPMKSVPGAKAFAITLEPAGGSLAPSGEKYAAGEI